MERDEWYVERQPDGKYKILKTLPGAHTHDEDLLPIGVSDVPGVERSLASIAKTVRGIYLILLVLFALVMIWAITLIALVLSLMTG
jgi:hypothetical protein